MKNRGTRWVLLAGLLAAAAGCVDDTSSSNDGLGDGDAGSGDAGRNIGGEGGAGGEGGGPGPDCMPTGAETCNGADDDCDGTIDEGFGDLGRACSAGEGACAADGVIACSADGAVAECDAVAGMPSIETCNGADDDCDGTVDEDADVSSDVNNCGACGAQCQLAAATPSCVNGACAVMACDAGFADTDGDPSNGCECATAGDEACNGEDDDCDGTVDEGLGLGGDCSAGVGACERIGTMICDAGGNPVCDAEAGMPGEEVCNGRDDDCDGMADEGVDRDDCNVPFGRVDNLDVAGENDNRCQDLDGDGTPDNALGPAAFFVNGEIDNVIGDGSLNVMLGTVGLDPPGADGVFTLVLLPSRQSAAMPGAFEPREDAFDMNGEPLVALPAEVVNGALEAGPGNFVLPFAGGGVQADLELVQTVVSGTLSVAEGGVTLRNAVVSGAVTEEAFDAALAGVDAFIRDLATRLIQKDLDLNGDGVNDAYSACALFSAVPATLVGWP